MESKSNSSILDQNLSTGGFNTIFRKDRNSFGGGILVYVSNSLVVKRRTDLEPTNIECIWVEISGPTSIFCFVVHIAYCIFVVHIGLLIVITLFGEIFHGP